MEQSGTRSGNSFNTVKQSIAEKLERAAGSLGRQTDEGAVLGPYGRQASAWLHHSAAYVRDFDLERANTQLRNQIRTYPGRSMLIGLAAGVMVGLLLRRR